MSDLLHFEIQYWNTDKNRWDMQSGGNDTFSNIVNNWETWINRWRDTHYRLILFVTQEVVLAERE